MADTLNIFGTEYTNVTGIIAYDDNGDELTYTRGGGGAYLRTTIVPQQTVTPDNSRQAELTSTGSLVDGEAYIVTIDGVEWYTTCETLWGDNYTLGEPQWFWTTPSDIVYPFGVIFYHDDRTVALSDTNQHTVKVERLDLLDDSVNLINKSITANGTYNASSDNADGYSSVSVSVSAPAPTLQTKSKTYTPTTSQQTESVTADGGYDGLDAVNITVNAIPSTYVQPTSTIGSTTYRASTSSQTIASGTYHSAAATIAAVTQTNLSAENIKSGTTISVSNGQNNLWSVTGTYSGGGSGKNAQTVQQSGTRIATTTYGKACGDITVSKAGTYDVYWSAYRTSTSGTWATRLYINSAAASGTAGTEQTTFVNSYYQAIHLSNVSLSKDDVVSVYGKSRGTNYYLYVGQLTIIEA